MKTLPPALLEEFARKLRMLMKRQGLKGNAELARRVSKVAGRDVDRQLVHKWVNAISYPSIANREALADVLGVPATELDYAVAYEGGVVPAQLSTARVPFRYVPDRHNPALVRAEMSDVLTIDQAEKIAAILAPRATKGS